MTLHVTNSPFSQDQVELLNRLFPTLTETQKIWLSGYLASAQSDEQSQTEGQQTVQQTEANTRRVTLVYGSHTGNCESLAQAFSQQLVEQNFDVELASMDDFKPKKVKQVEDLLIITSTHGDGDPPDNALSFYDFLHSKRAPKLDGVRFSVLALGDSSYEFFCQTGKDLDQRLEQLQAERLHERVDCDLDFEEPAEKWMQEVILELNQQKAEPTQQEALTLVQGESQYSKKNPYHAEILENLNLNGRGSNKETRHLELDLEGSHLTYEPGDSLGIYPNNDPELVEQLLNALEWNPDGSVPVNKEGEVRSLREALSSIYDITTLSKPLLEKVSSLSPSLQEWLESSEASTVQDYVYGRDLVDVVKDFGPLQGEADQFVQALRKIPARLYSIASSSKANPDEVHLTIGALRYEAHGRARSGVCSVQCAERSAVGDRLPVFIQKNSNFKLPEQQGTPIIMIGAGTGIAPYRAFLQEREETEDNGEAWLFFGEQHFVSDFLYQTEWQSWLKDGVLTKMDVAFSRDTDQKVYVQHRLLENSKEVYAWLKEGAYLYVCGDEKHMAKDVHHALVEIVQQEGDKSPAEAISYLEQLRKEKRYQRDVY